MRPRCFQHVGKALATPFVSHFNETVWSVLMRKTCVRVSTRLSERCSKRPYSEIKNKEFVPTPFYYFSFAYDDVILITSSFFSFSVFRSSLISFLCRFFLFPISCAERPVQAIHPSLPLCLYLFLLHLLIFNCRPNSCTLLQSIVF